MTETWYRYEDRRYAAMLDEDERPLGPGRVEVHLLEFAVVKRTPKGVWIRQRLGDFTDTHKRFVLIDSNKRHACPTKDEAAESFAQRKRKQLRIYRARIASVEEALRIFEAGLRIEGRAW